MTIELAIVLITIIVFAMKVDFVRDATRAEEELGARLDGIPPQHPMCRCELPKKMALCRGGLADGHEFVDTGNVRYQVIVPRLDAEAPWQYVPAYGHKMPIFSRVKCVYYRADLAGCTPTHWKGQQLYYHESMVKEGACLDD